MRSWHRWEDGPLSANAKPVIGLVGFYRYGNFGDDLYCHLFATFLRGLGYPVRMYALDNSYLRVEGAETIDELPTFLDSIDVLVYGGGGLLIKGSPFRTPAKWLEELVVLAREIEARKLPFVAVSVGGDGMLFRANVDSPRIRLARQARWITLRNGADQVPLRALGVATEVYPDVILQTPTMIRGEPRHAGDRTVRIGIHLYLPRLITWWFRLLVMAAAIVRPEREFVFFETKIGGKPWRSLRPPRWLRRPNVVLYSCIDPARDVGMLRSLDVMISSRLHLGLTGLAYGIPLIAFGAQQKTRVQLQRLKLDAALWPRSHWWRLFRFLGADDPTAQLGPRPQLDLFEKEVVASRAHFDALARWLEELPACRARGGTPTGAPPGG